MIHPCSHTHTSHLFVSKEEACYTGYRRQEGYNVSPLNYFTL